MSNQYRCGNLIITAPSEWEDITGTVEGGSAPFTLAKVDGTGALQFSVATYKGGKIPNVTVRELDELRDDFAQKKELGRSTGVKVDGGLRVSAGTYEAGEYYMRVWYCSDGRNVAVVTYTAGRGEEGEEPDECEAIVAGLRFG